MDLRHYLTIIRRQRWIIIEAVVIVAVVAGVLSALKTPHYASTARVLLRPNDPSEQLYSTFLYYDPDRYLAAQSDVIQSEGVAREAAKALNGGTPGEVQSKITVEQSDTTDVLGITATDLDPVRARDIANAVATAYIEHRKDEAVGDLDRVADELEERLAAFQAQIAEYDARIGDGGISPGATATVQAPTAPKSSGPTPASNEGPTSPGIDPGQPTPTTNEGLKAARYAAAVKYQEVYARQQEILIEMSLKRGGAELVSEAKTPAAPVGTGTTSNALLGGFVGLLLGLGVAFLREQLDDRTRSREDVERAAGLPIIADLPFDAESASQPSFVATVDKSQSAMAEATRSLRTGLHFLGIDKPLGRIVVTSPSPGEGKSVVAANLAAAYAQAGYVTVLVSGDLRRPHVEEMFGYERGAYGLTGLIAELPGDSRPPPRPGQTRRTRRTRVAADANGSGNGNGNGHDEATVLVKPDLGDALVPTGVHNLLLLPAGPTPPNPAEVLASRRMTEILDDLSASADVVVIDTPPIVAVTDGAVLAAKSDGVLLVAAQNETHRGALKRSREVLDSPQIRMLGVVLNKSHRGGASYDGYYYRYYRYYGDEASRHRRLSLRRRRTGRVAEPTEVGS